MLTRDLAVHVESKISLDAISRRLRVLIDPGDWETTGNSVESLLLI